MGMDGLEKKIQEEMRVALLISFRPHPCSPELTRSGGIEVLSPPPPLLGKILTPNQFHSVVHQLVGVLTGFE